MKIDLRDMKGRTPRCEMGLCKSRSTMSLGDATSRGALGRLNVCDDCATQIKELLKDKFEASEEVEVVTEEVEVVTEEVEVVTETPDGEQPVALESLTLTQLKEHATTLGIEFKSKVKKDELLIMIDLNG